MNKNISIILGIILIVLVLAGNPFYIVSEGEQAIITMFGKPRGEPVIEAGLKLKIPFLEKVTKFEKRIMEWDGYPNQIPTKDKRYIWVDTTARWRITTPLKFFQSVYNERGAHAMLDDIIDSAVRDAVTSQKLIEIVRSSNRIAEDRESGKSEQVSRKESILEKIEVGRDKIREDILKKAQELAPQYGIALIDIRIKRINYVEEVKRKVYERMIAERKQAAEQYRSEGRGIRAEIEGRTEKELKIILSEAYKKSQEIKGKADAQTTKIYAEAYSKDLEFYSFLKTLETYDNTVDDNTIVIFTTDGEYFKYLKQISP